MPTHIHTLAYLSIRIHILYMYSMLYVRFMLEANIRSLHTANPKKLIVADLNAHYITKRYTELIISLLTIQSIHTNDNTTTTSSSTNQHSLTSPTSTSNTTFTTTSFLDGLAGSGGESMLHTDLTHLRSEMVSLLDRLSATIHFSNNSNLNSNNSSNIQKLIFLINNYDYISAIFQERLAICSNEINYYETNLYNYKELFAEELIKNIFPRLISFVIQTEQLMMNNGGHNSDLYTNTTGTNNTTTNITTTTNSNNTNNTHTNTSGHNSDLPNNTNIILDEILIENIIHEFNTTWKLNIQLINDQILSYFNNNFINSMNILKLVLTQLLLYYTRFQDILKKVFTTTNNNNSNNNKQPLFLRDLVSTANILMEIKRYSR